MATDSSHGYVPPDPTRIDAKSADALKFWSGTLNAPEDRIRQAVQKVGPELDQVKLELGIGGAD
jgi:hypothetical protein